MAAEATSSTRSPPQPPSDADISSVVNVRHQVGKRGYYVITEELTATHPSFPVPRSFHLQSRELSQREFSALTQPSSLSSQDIMTQALKAMQPTPLLQSLRLSLFEPPKPTFIRHKVGKRDYKESPPSFPPLRTFTSEADLDRAIAQMPPKPTLSEEELDRSILTAASKPPLSETDLDYAITHRTPLPVQKELTPLEASLAARGLRLANSQDQSEMRVHQCGGLSHVWGKYVSDPISRSIHWIGHETRSLFSSQYREQYKHAVKACQMEKYSHLVYSKQEVDAQLTEVTRLISEIDGKYLGQKIAADTGLWLAAGNCYTSGPPVLKGLTMTSAVLLRLLAHDPQAEQKLAEWDAASTKLRTMIEKNQVASYEKSLKKGYEPTLYYKPNLTKEELQMSAWGIEFLVDNEGFQFGISVDHSF